MPPFSFQKSIKIGSKLELGRHRIFVIDFCIDLSPSGCGPRPFAQIPFPPKNLPKIIQKSIKKRPTIYLKSTQNQPKMDLLRGLGGFLGGPGGFLGRLETNLRAKMAPRWNQVPRTRQVPFECSHAAGRRSYSNSIIHRFEGSSTLLECSTRFRRLVETFWKAP